MRPAILITLALLLAPSSHTSAMPQEREFHLTRISPYDRAVPGEIMQALIEGLGGEPPVTMPSADEFQVEVSQDGVAQQAKVRLVSATMMSQTMSHQGAPTPPSPPNERTMHAYQSVSFVVPQALHPGDTEVTISYRGRRSNTVNLTIVERPLRPVVGGVAIMTINPASLPPPGTIMRSVGWRLERGTTAQMHVNPLVDPEDGNASILIRFKQGEVYYDAAARVVHEDRKVENRGRGVAFLNAREFLEVEIPAGLSMGEAEIEVRLRANGQTSDPAVMKVTIIESTPVAEAPAENAPRILAAMPRRIGAGQALMLSVDHLRTLAPDPSKTLVVIEREGARYTVVPEKNTGAFRPSAAPDTPVSLMVRPTSQLIGSVQVRVLNSMLGEQGGLSPAIPIEIVDEVLPPELINVAEATVSELGSLRQMYETQSSLGRKFPAYDPSRRYLSIRARGIDPNPRFVRIRLEQPGHTSVLEPSDFSLYAGEVLIVRLPEGFQKGPISISIENRGSAGFSDPVRTTFTSSGPS